MWSRAATGASLLLIAIGCGTPAESSTVAPAPRNTAGVVEVDYEVNGCPDFYTFVLEPPKMGLRTPAFVAAYAEDPEEDAISYSFGATSGKFTDTHENSTMYHCLELGPQVISVLAVDARNCSRVLNIHVTCGEN